MLYLESLILLLVICAGLSYYFRESKSQHSSLPQAVSEEQEGRNTDYGQYTLFRNNYLLVYLCMMLGDWLQGPYVYVLYRSYGYSLEEIGILFVVGFLSSALFGTVISSLADKIGRRTMCIAFSCIYIASCFTKLSNNFQILLLGRLLGGISTSLLFSVFEAWLVSEHHSRHFPSEWLSATFSWATYGNGLIAIFSGILADFAVKITHQSYVAPFMLSAFFLGVGGVIVTMSWSENYGEKEDNVSASSTGKGLWKSMQQIWRDKRILSVGTIVSCFEGSMYTFVFMWSPVLEASKTSSEFPFGIVFAAFMVCIMIGSIGFRVALKEKYSVEQMIQPILLVAAIALSIPIFTQNPTLCFWSFNLFELCCGFYFPVMGTLRSKYVPEDTRATVMNLFRVPLNLIVVVVLTNVSVWSASFIFGICVILLLISLGVSFILLRSRF